MHSKINSLKRLSNFLNIDNNILIELSQNDYNILVGPSQNVETLSDVLSVRKFFLQKRNGEYRIVYSPSSDNLTNCLKILNSKLQSIFKPINNVHGYIKGRGIKTNAAEHINKKFILKIDIENYFNNISEKKIVESLDDLNFQTDISSVIAHITTHEKKLIQGFHTSPTIANIIFHKLDIRFSTLKNITYTRYADDLYFSSNEEFDILSIVKEAILEYGFNINESKTKFMKRGQKQYVTGLTVFDSIKPRISKNKKKELRQIIYYINKFGYKGHIMHKHGISHEDYINDEVIKNRVDEKIYELKQKTKGWLLFINSIEPSFKDKYWKLI